MRFTEDLKARVSKAQKKIVLPETNSRRVLKAAERVLADGFAKIVLVGKLEQIKKDAAKFQIDLTGVEALHVPTSFGANLYIDNIARYSHRNKNHYIVIAPQRFPFCRYGNDLKRLYQRIICLFSCHFCCIFVSRKDSNPYLCMKFYDSQ